MRAGIALGSNIGDSHAVLSLAIKHLQEIHESGPFLASSFIETEPEDCPPGSPPFLNAVAEIETSHPPEELLKLLQELEVASGRPRNHAYHSPRTLDLDLLYCDQMSLNTEALQLPHPRIRERLFVLKPLGEIRPDLKLPAWEFTTLEYIRTISK